MDSEDKVQFLKAYITCIQGEGRGVNEGQCEYLRGLLDAIIDYDGKTAREQAAQKNNDIFRRYLSAYRETPPTKRADYLLEKYNYEDRGEPVKLLGSENSTYRVIRGKRVKKVERDAEGRVVAIVESDYNE